MKTFAKITVLAASFFAAALPLLSAADVPANTTTATPPAGDQPGVRGLARRKAVRQRIAQRLGLTADQITQLKASRAKTAAAIKALRADPSLTTEQKKAKALELRQAARTEMRGVLTPDQQEKMGKLRAFMRGRMSARPPI